MTIEYGMQQSRGITNADLDLMKANGATWVRLTFSMSAVWSTNARFTADTPSYTSTDGPLVDYAHSIGLKVLVVITYCPGWLGNGCVAAGLGQHETPNNFDTWAEMARRAVRDYGSKVDAWEIWNEANNYQFWAENPPAKNRYPLLLRKVILAMRTVDANCFIMNSGPASGGSSTENFNPKWDASVALATNQYQTQATCLDSLFDPVNGIVPGNTPGTPYLSAYAIHVYTTSASTPLSTIFENCFMHVDVGFRNIGDRTLFPNGYSFWKDIICAHEGYDPVNPPAGHKLVWNTEAGLPDAGTHGSQTYTPQRQADQLEITFSTWEQRNYTGPYIYFNLRDADPARFPSADLLEQHAGLLQADGTPKLALQTFQNHAITTPIPTTNESGFGIYQPDAATIDINRIVTEAKANGASWVRVLFDWSQIQSIGSSTFDWTSTDTWVSEATAAGMKIVGVLAFTPSWARAGGTDKFTPPSGINGLNFLNFATAAQTRYPRQGGSRRVAAWEVWDEPNSASMWKPSPSVQAYTDLLSATTSALVGADAQAITLVGALGAVIDDGVNLAPATFVTQLYGLASRADFAAIAVKPDRFPTSPGTMPVMQAVFNVMSTKGDAGKQIWGTSLSYPSHPDNVTTGIDGREVSETQQATNITNAIAMWKTKAFAGPLLIRGWRDSGTDLLDYTQNEGLVHADWSPKAARDAFALGALGSLPSVTVPVRNYSNLATTQTLVGQLAANSNQLQLPSTAGFPTKFPYFLVIDRNLPTEEVVSVIGGSGQFLTVTRGVSGTQTLHAPGATVQHAVTAQELTEWATHYSNPNHDHHKQYIPLGIIEDVGCLIIVMPDGTVDMVHSMDAPSGAALHSDGLDPYWGFALPTGSIAFYGGSTPPSGWLKADGSAVSRTTYADLFALIGTTYGVGDGSSTFNVPNLNGRTVVGAGSGAGLTSRALSAAGGEEAHAQVAAELPVHTHTQNAHNHTQNAHNHTPAGGGQFVTNPNPSTAAWIESSGSGHLELNGGSATTATTAVNRTTIAVNQNAGLGTPANVMQPYLAVGAIIKV